MLISQNIRAVAAPNRPVPGLSGILRIIALSNRGKDPEKFRAKHLAIDPPGRKISKTQNASSNTSQLRHPVMKEVPGTRTSHGIHCIQPGQYPQRDPGRRSGDSKVMHIIMSWAKAHMIRWVVRWNPVPNLGGRSSVGLF